MKKIPKALAEVRKWKREISQRTAKMTKAEEITYIHSIASNEAFLAKMREARRAHLHGNTKLFKA